MEDRCRALETDKEAILASNAAVCSLYLCFFHTQSIHIVCRDLSDFDFAHFLSYRTITGSKQSAGSAHQGSGDVDELPGGKRQTASHGEYCTVCVSLFGVFVSCANVGL